MAPLPSLHTNRRCNTNRLSRRKSKKSIVYAMPTHRLLSIIFGRVRLSLKATVRTNMAKA
jgi:hypothetical protein